MVFYKHFSSYSIANAEAAIGNEQIILVGLKAETQVKFEDNKPTNEVTGKQVWVATETHNPFKIKLPADCDIDLSAYKIGDSIEFEHLEAIEMNRKIYFRAKDIKKKGK